MGRPTARASVTEFGNPPDSEAGTKQSATSRYSSASVTSPLRLMLLD